jgi:hypothetical protein
MEIGEIPLSQIDQILGRHEGKINKNIALSCKDSFTDLKVEVLLLNCNPGKTP